jgi:hypothetical protein
MFIVGGIDKYAPQFKPETLEAKMNSVTDISGIKQMIPTDLFSLFTSSGTPNPSIMFGQKGGKKLSKSNKITESYLKLKI